MHYLVPCSDVKLSGLKDQFVEESPHFVASVARCLGLLYWGAPALPSVPHVVNGAAAAASEPGGAKKRRRGKRFCIVVHVIAYV